MADYSSQKVPDLKKLLSERGLVISGNKADLIARLQEDDTKKNGGAAASGAGEDEIDWDEDDNKLAAGATTAPAAAAIAAGGVGQVNTPIAVPNQRAAIDPSTTSDLTVKQPETESTSAPAVEGEKVEVLKPEEPKKDFTIGLGLSEAEKEAEKRAARAKRFARPETAAAPAKEQTEEEKKLEERAKKFGTDKVKEKEVVSDIVKGLNSALPERKLKRERGGDGAQGRQAKRQTPDRRTEAPRRGDGRQQGQGRGERGGGRGGVRKAGGGGGAAAGQGLKKITDDPDERAKAEARAKRFAPAK